jgi:hypothetical protein
VNIDIEDFARKNDWRVSWGRDGDGGVFEDINVSYYAPRATFIIAPLRDHEVHLT